MTLYVEKELLYTPKYKHPTWTPYVIFRHPTKCYLQNVTYVEYPTKCTLRALYEITLYVKYYFLYVDLICRLRGFVHFYDNTPYEVHPTKLQPTNQKPPTDD